MVSSGGEGEVAIGLGEVGGMVDLSCVGEVGLCIHSASNTVTKVSTCNGTSSQELTFSFVGPNSPTKLKSSIDVDSAAAFLLCSFLSII